MPSIILKPGRERSLLRRHPWVFSGAVRNVDDGLQPGATVDILSAAGQFLARGFYSPHSQIRARVWTFNDEPVDEAFFRRRIQGALALRRALRLRDVTDALRLIYAESDGIPGLIVDQYGDTLVLQCLTAGVELWRETLADLLLQETGLECIFERSDADVRELEGLPPRVGLLRGQLTDFLFPISEHGLRFNVDLASSTPSPTAFPVSSLTSMLTRWSCSASPLASSFGARPSPTCCCRRLDWSASSSAPMRMSASWRACRRVSAICAAN